VKRKSEIQKIGMQCRKVGSAKADADKQESFKKDKLEPVFTQAKNGDAAVFFLDAAHFVLAPFLGYLWSFCRIFLKAPAGRKRFNVLGALDAISHQRQLLTILISILIAFVSYFGN